MPARVTHVDKIIDAASNTFRVRLSLPNPGNRLPAGARCKVDESSLSAIAVPGRGSL
jgi:multidrug efflux pump subunit AcrA (membrane-fusion protein)